MAKSDNLNLGPLPVKAIAAALGLHLAPGDVLFTGLAQRHAQERHPTDFPLCLLNASRIVEAPAYVGQSPRQIDGLELIGEAVEDGALVLVAVELRPDRRGRYYVASTYRIERGTLDRRLRKGFAKAV